MNGLASGKEWGSFLVATCVITSLLNLSKSVFEPQKLGLLDVVPDLTIVTMLVFLFVWQELLSGNRTTAVPAEQESRLQKGLAAHKIWVERVRLVTDGSVSREPEARVELTTLLLPLRAVRDLSQEALLWSAGTSLLASRLFYWKGIPAFFFSLSVTSAFIGYFEQTPWARVASLIGASFVVSLAIWLYCEFRRSQFEADLRLSQTEAGREAAREALSYAYYNCLWVTPGAEGTRRARAIRQRAKRLGIELQDGFHASRHNLAGGTVGTPPTQLR